MVKAQTKLLVDWDNDDDFLDTGEDVSSRLVRVEWGRGRDNASALTGRSIAGQLRALLDNTSEDFSSFNTSSPLTGNVLPGRKVRLEAPPPLGIHLVFDAPTTAAHAVVISDDAAIQNVFGGGGTIEIMASPTTGGVGGQSRLLEKLTSGGLGWSLRINDVSGGLYRVEFRHTFSGDDGVWRTDRVITMTEWATVAVTYDNGDVSNNPLIFVGGVSVTVNETTTPVGTADSDVGGDIAIGRRSFASSFGWDGGLDDARVWDDIRTPAEIAANHLVELEGNEPGLKGYWKLNEGTGTNAADATANGNDGTLAGSPAPVWTVGDGRPLWVGFLDRVRPRPSLHGPKRAELMAFGPLAFINQRRLDLAMKTSILTGTAFGAVLDEAGWPAADRDIDAGQSTMDRFWVDGKHTLPALRMIERSESGFILETADGKIRFEDRHRRLKAPHLTSQATFSDALAATLRYSNPIQEDPLPFVFNRFEAEIRRFTVGSLAVLWTLSESGANSPLIAQGETRTFSAKYPTPAAASDAVAVDAWTTPVSATDYTANSASDGSGTDLTSDLALVVTKVATAMEIAVTNNGSTAAFLTLLQARGTPVTVDDPVKVSAVDTVSEAKYGERTFPLVDHFIANTEEGQQWAAYNLAIYKQEIPILALTISANIDLAHLTEVLERDISDRITVVATSIGSGLGINEDFFIESMRHTIDEETGVHRVRWELSPASGVSGFWVLGTSELATETVLAY